MLFLRDMSCSVCNRVMRDVMLEPRELVAILDCPNCGSQDHVAVCNGGCGTRWRENDFPDDPRFYRGQVTVEAPTAECEGKPVCDMGGAVIHEGERFGTDARSDRQERMYWQSDKTRGRTPLYFDTRK